MIARIAGKVLWGASKATMKYVVLPIAYTAALAFLMDKAADKIRDSTPTPDGLVAPEITPAP